MEVLGLEKGDYVEVELEKNQIVLKPRKMIDPTQGWYWTRKGQKIERGESSPAFKKRRGA